MAVEWLQKAADAGHLQSIFELAAHYQQGQFVAKDTKKAIELYEVVVANGSIPGMIRLSKCYADDGDVQNPEKAFQWMQKAAETGDAQALCELGYYYVKGVGVQADTKQGLEYFERSAQKKGSGLFALGECYRDGVGVTQDLQKALEYFQQSSAAGDARALKEVKAVRKRLRSQSKS